MQEFLIPKVQNTPYEKDPFIQTQILYIMWKNFVHTQQNLWIMCHKRSVHETIYLECDKCSFTTSKSSYMKHETWFYCIFNGPQFSSHEQVGDACDLCKYQSKRAYVLKNHKRVFHEKKTNDANTYLALCCQHLRQYNGNKS